MIDSIQPEAGTVSADLKKSRRKTSATAGLPKVDRLPPHSVEAEQGVLGCVLLSPNDCMGECIEKLKPGHLVFYDLRHQTLFQTLTEMYDQKQAIDLITLQQRLKNKQQSKEWAAWLICPPCPTPCPRRPISSITWTSSWKNTSCARWSRPAPTSWAGCYDYEGEVDALLDEVERDILRISEERVAGASLTIKELVNHAITKIEEYHQNQGMLTGLGDRVRGFRQNDHRLARRGNDRGGRAALRGQDLPGHEHRRACRAGDESAGGSVQPGNDRRATGLAHALLPLPGQPAQHPRRLPGRARFSQVDRRGRQAGGGAACSWTTVPALSILQLRAKARRMWQQYGIKLFVIDYLQLLHSTSRRAENRQQEIADISGGIKALAKELAVPMIVLSQLNRELEKRGPGERPRLSDLRESGAIEQDADLVGLLYRETKNKDGEEDANEAEQDAIAVKLYIAKQRNGPTGDVDLTFLKSYTRFESAAKVSAEDVPADA